MSSAPKPEAGDVTLPLHAEEISISRQNVVGDTVRVSTVTREYERLIDECLTQERVEIERVAIGRPVDTAPPVREEGDTTIIPVLEEIVVVERRLILKEEVRIRRVRTTEHHRETVMVRDQDALVTRVEAGRPAEQGHREPLATNPTERTQEQN